MKNDWNKGNESMMTSIERLMYHQEWLQKQHQDVKDKIHSRVKVEEKPIMGFVKD